MQKKTDWIPEEQGSIHQLLPDQSTITAESQSVRTLALGEERKQIILFVQMQYITSRRKFDRLLLQH